MYRIEKENIIIYRKHKKRKEVRKIKEIVEKQKQRLRNIIRGY